MQVLVDKRVIGQATRATTKTWQRRSPFDDNLVRTTSSIKVSDVRGDIDRVVGRADDARAMLAEIYGGFSEGFDTYSTRASEPASERIGLEATALWETAVSRLRGPSIGPNLGDA
jgi:hypothetical protein